MSRLAGAGLVAAAFLLPATISMADSSSPGAEAQRQVTFRGAPPFKRRVAPASADVQVASRAVRSTGVAVRGRPPFKRQLDVTPVEDGVVFARLEEQSGERARKRRPGPPGKRAPFIR